MPFSLVQSHLIDFINNLNRPPIVVISGDITFQGSGRGYEIAKEFFREIQARTSVKRHDFIICPGNHDIMRGSPFSGFDSFSYSIRRDKLCCFSGQSCTAVEHDGVYFLLSNSSYHQDYSYGLVDLDAVKTCLKDKAPPNSGARIAISHHHLIPISEGDLSTTRNAYGLLEVLGRHGFAALLHGHQHYTTGLKFGSAPTQLFGVSSFNFGQVGILNGLNLYEIETDGLKSTRYALVVDGHFDHSRGFLHLNS